MHHPSQPQVAPLCEQACNLGVELLAQGPDSHAPAQVTEAGSALLPHWLKSFAWENVAAMHTWHQPPSKLVQTPVLTRSCCSACRVLYRMPVLQYAKPP